MTSGPTPLKKNTPRSQASRDSGAAVLAPPLGAGWGGAWRGGRSPRAAGTEEAEQPRATRAGERRRGVAAGAGRGARGRAAGLRLRSRWGDSAHGARPCHPRRSGGPRLCCARRPRAAGGAAPPAPVSHWGLRPGGCGSLRTPERSRRSALAPAPGPLSLSAPDAEGTGGRHEVAGARCRQQTVLKPLACRSPTRLSPVRGRFSDPEVWRKVVQRCEVGLERRCCRSALLPPPGTRGSAGALALWLLSATWDAFR